MLGAMGDRYGRRLAMVTSIVLFTGRWPAALRQLHHHVLARLVIGMGMAVKIGQRHLCH